MLSTVVERIGVVVAAFLGFLALFPFSGVDTDPPEFLSVYGNRVPTDSPWLAVGLGVLTLVVLELVRRRMHRDAGR